MVEFHRPQLAKTVKPELFDWDDFESHVSELKEDGHRRLMGRNVAWSRIGKEHSHPLIQPRIPDKWLLDGEIVPIEGKASSNVVSHMLADSPEKLKFIVFDVLYAGDVGNVMGLKWSQRRGILEDWLPTTWNEVICLSEVHSDHRALHEEAARLGYEGIILKDPRAPYKPNSRSAWVKVKFRETYDVVITDCDSKPTEWRVRPGEVGKDGVLYPDGLHAESWSKGYVNLSYGFYDEETGELRRVGSLGFTGPVDELQEHVGKVAECCSFGPQYETGALRHPGFIRWRDPDDKSAEECIFNFME